MASAEFHKWHRQNIDPQGSFQVDNFAKCWADAIKSAEALKPSHDNESISCEIGIYDEPCKLGYPCKCKHGCLIKRTAYTL